MYPGNIGITHGFAADIGMGDERELLAQPGLRCRQGLLLLAGVGTLRNGLPAGNFGVAPEDLEAAANFVYPVINRFQFGGFVHQVVGCA